MSDIPEEPPDENEAFENLDEALDEEDVLGSESGGGPEGTRDLDTELIVDKTELREAGADLDDPEQLSILDGGMDDPDGSGPPRRPAGTEEAAGWDVDPVAADEAGAHAVGADEVGADGEAPDDVPGGGEGPDLELTDADATDLEQIPDDAPGADSARGWARG